MGYTSKKTTPLSLTVLKLTKKLGEVREAIVCWQRFHFDFTGEWHGCGGVEGVVKQSFRVLGAWGTFSPIFQRSKHSPEKVNTLPKVTRFSCITVIYTLSLDLFQKGFKET